ncbi:PVC-type heme-binding CxxCH protein [Larkinella soli]|uniref:PVC-type heme-binding CxxCH protein n=1 Tax=Larkinella soli TaxID=1770527 RepID=UPI001E301708|nr:PVC-type heme-binding CxxCH protein [Larkinella soli]
MRCLSQFYAWFSGRLPVPAGLLVAGLCSFMAGSGPVVAPAGMPRLLDDRLELTLFAENPDIVTPIGIAVDRQNRLFVLESHTHLRPSGYQGPDSDQIKRMTDEDRDGRPDRITVFADGLKEGLNLAFSPDGTLYAVTSKAVWVLFDRDEDGVCEEKKKVLELVKPATVYAHAALLGITFSPDGWMYVSRGNTGGAAWELKGTDGSSLGGYGDGGNIVRARPDGSALEEVATGFWNPVDLKFDSRGRLLAIDNDPDSRGPNRMVHVVQGGDYGYQSLYGGSGIHPYLAWNGELPGTLPYAVGLGEAPTGLLNADGTALPPDYGGQWLCSVWEESRLVRIRTVPKGASVTGTYEVVAEGDGNFRPVAFAADQTGAVYITDWVLRDYPNHGRGRIWKLTARKGVPAGRPHSRPKEPADGRLDSLFAARLPGDTGMLVSALTADDPFVRHAAVVALARPVFHPEVARATSDKRAEVRLGALLALRRSGQSPEPLARRLLRDADPHIRRQALQWIGQTGMESLRPCLDSALTAGPLTAGLFETYLETVAHLMPAYQTAYRNRTEALSKSIKRSLPPRFIEALVADAARPAPIRALAIRFLPKPEEQVELLLGLLEQSNDPALRLEAIRTLAGIPDGRVGRSLLRVAGRPGGSEAVRAEALLALAGQPVDAVREIAPLLREAFSDLRIEAARYLRTRLTPARFRPLMTPGLVAAAAKDAALREQLELALGSPAGRKGSSRPQNLAGWERVLAEGGNAERGRRVFFSVEATCSACHRVMGRGGDLGPDLSQVGRSKSRLQLVRSILRPSGEISPEWQGWYVRLVDGREIQGRQIDIGEKTVELYTQADGFVTVPRKEIREYGMIRNSLMPDGLESRLTGHDLRDLLAFLQAVP